MDAEVKEPMTKTTISLRDLLDAGCHFGHTRGRRHPQTKEYVFLTREKVDIIDLEKALAKLNDLSVAVENFLASGQTLVMVGTKRQAKEVTETVAQAVGLPYVSERWLGGTLTNFETVRKSIKKMNDLAVFLETEEAAELTKRERLMQQRELERLRFKFGGLADLTKVPDGLFIIDPTYEKIAVSEARALEKTIFALLDTNSNPDLVDEFVIANDDATKSIRLIMQEIQEALERGQVRAKETAKVAAEVAESGEAATNKDEVEKLTKEKPKTEVKNEVPTNKPATKKSAASKAKK